VLLALPVAAIGVVVLASAIASRARAGRLPRSLVVQYTPARDSSVIGDALLADRDRRAASAALLDLAVRRRIRLLADTSRGRKSTVGVELLDGTALATPELDLLAALFGPGHTHERVRRFSKDRRAVGRRLRALVGRNVADLRRAGLVAGESEGRRVLRVLGWLGILATIASAAVSLALGDAPALMLSIAALGTAIAVLVVTPVGAARRFAPAATPRREHLDGLRQYMTVAEADRMRALQSPDGAELLDASAEVRAELGTDAGRFRLHERLLPYAVIFGIEKEWMTHLRLAYADLDDRSLAALGDVLDSTADLFALADALGDLAELGFAVGDLMDTSGAAFDVVGGVFEAIGSISP
jgi:hypothetical protein